MVVTRLADTFDGGISGFAISHGPCRPVSLRNAVEWLRPGCPVREEDAVALLDGYESVRPLRAAELAALPELLPLVHAEFALSELGYRDSCAVRRGSARW
ncbi:hypothetical protein [Streptomyces sp. NBC_00140]|uniref:hypothetical protein n=1 Tax=Streptomyces sp. NBC_00140 TaxID=2975664 RepID=UPI00225529D4|nr:hypothetical protein [Streptomyces sp. NBC_00140]MCX5328729.1 hypothetical protein [Streptomyces sp. NBC_00140]